MIFIATYDKNENSLTTKEQKKEFITTDEKKEQDMSELDKEWGERILSPLKYSEVQKSESVIWKAKLNNQILESRWAKNGSYIGRASQCTVGYNSETNILSGKCDIGTPGNTTTEYFEWRNIVSSGYHSNKFTQTLTTGVFPPFLPNETPDLIEGVSFGEATETNQYVETYDSCKSWDYVKDLATSLPLAIRCTGDTEKLIATDLATETLQSFDETLNQIEQSVTDAEKVYREDWGFEQLTLDEAQTKTSYTIPNISSTIPEFELDEIFYTEKTKLRENFNPKARDVVIQIYRNGYEEIIITSRGTDFIDEWFNDPLALSGEQFPLDKNQVSEIAYTQLATPHFWGKHKNSVITVEGYNTSTQTLENIRTFFKDN